MKLFIQIGIGQWKQTGYDQPWLHFASSLSDDIVGTDLDNDSETLVADLVIRLLSQAEKVFVLIQASDPRAPLGALAKVFHIFQAQIQRVDRVVLLGEHHETEKMSAGWSEKFVQANEEGEIRELLRAFAQ